MGIFRHKEKPTEPVYQPGSLHQTKNPEPPLFIPIIPGTIPWQLREEAQSGTILDGGVTHQSPRRGGSSLR